MAVAATSAAARSLKILQGILLILLLAVVWRRRLLLILLLMKLLLLLISAVRGRDLLRLRRRWRLNRLLRHDRCGDSDGDSAIDAEFCYRDRLAVAVRTDREILRIR